MSKCTLVRLLGNYHTSKDIKSVKNVSSQLNGSDENHEVASCFCSGFWEAAWFQLSSIRSGIQGSNTAKMEHRRERLSKNIITVNGTVCVCVCVSNSHTHNIRSNEYDGKNLKWWLQVVVVGMKAKALLTQQLCSTRRGSLLVQDTFFNLVFLDGTAIYSLLIFIVLPVNGMMLKWQF